MTIQWDDSFSVNVAEIDQQHRKLISMVNELSDAMKEGKGKEVVGGIVNRLVSYTIEHFKTEEKYFDRFGYPETASHKKEHARFVQRAAEFKQRFEKGSLGLSVDVMTFISDWLRNHIQGTDKKYTQFFNAKGLK